MILPSLSRFWFKFVHTNFLIYNISWEDSAIDRQLLKLNPESEILMITGAGCNALNYLLDDPRSIHCVDINPRQNALLDLKIALIRHTDHSTFFEFFGTGKTRRFLKIYKVVRPHLKETSRRFWDTHIKYFSHEGDGLFYQGGAGMFARFLNKAIDQKSIRGQVERMLQETNPTKRAAFYKRIEPSLFSGLQQSLWKTPLILSLAGIPKSQQEAVGDLNKFMRSTLYTLFVEQDPSDNYFWKVYLNGHFTSDCCPPYLDPANFEILQERVTRIEFSDSDLLSFLRSSDKIYSHLVLLDHMDWLTDLNREQLHEEWEEMLRITGRDSRILFRTAHSSAGFLPESLREKVDLQLQDPEWIRLNDRVGTYTGTYLGIRS